MVESKLMMLKLRNGTRGLRLKVESQISTICINDLSNKLTERAKAQSVAFGLFELFPCARAGEVTK